jgi:hypothetical protein
MDYSQYQWLNCWDRGFESRWKHRKSSLVFVVYVVASAMSWSLVTEVIPSACVRVRDIVTSKMRRPTSDLACGAIDKNGLHLGRGGRDSSVSIVNRYGLNGPGIESRLGRDFPHPSRQALGATQPPIKWAPGLFTGRKAAGAWRWPPTPCSVEVKEIVELYIYSSSGASWPALGWTLPLSFYEQNIRNYANK